MPDWPMILQGAKKRFWHVADFLQSVIPAKAGIHAEFEMPYFSMIYATHQVQVWTPAFTGVTISA
jgi:hypothetical protein